VLSEHTCIEKQISHYRLLDRIGSSPLCHVYRAEHLQLTQHIVTIKVFQVPSLSPQKRQQFLQEVQLLSKLKHPHILPILDAGFYEDAPYIVTDYLLDGSLRSRLPAHSQHLLPLQECIAILNQLGQALQYSHQCNILHNNLKPENILFTSENKVMLTDFHIGTLLDGASPEASYYSNTWPYMAPEQFIGSCTRDNDQYALGCIAYELFTGRTPFISSNFSTIQHQHFTENPLAPTHLNLLLPFPIGQVILKALEKKSVDRYPSIKDFMVALNLSVPASFSTSRLPPLESASPSTPRPFMMQDNITSSLKDTELPQESPVYLHRTMRPSVPAPAPSVSPELPLSYTAYTEQQEHISSMNSAPPATVFPKHIQDLTRLLTKHPTTSEEVANSQINDEQLSHAPVLGELSAPENNDASWFYQEVLSKATSIPSSTETQPQPVLPEELPDTPLSVAPEPQILDAENVPDVQARDALHPVHEQTTQQLIMPSYPLPQGTLFSTPTFGSSLNSRTVAPKFISKNRGNNTPNHFSRRAWLIIGGSWLFVVAMIFSFVHVLWPVLSSTASPIMTATPVVHQAATMPAHNPVSTPILLPFPTPTHNSAPSLLPTVTPTPSPTPVVTPSPTPTSSLVVTPTSLHASSCQKVGAYYFCTLLLQLPSTHQGMLRWSTSSNGGFASFIPARGKLSPGTQQSVRVYVHSPCPHAGQLIISSRDGKVSVPWTC
jgi:serine/threonine protein kinase